MFYNLNTPHFSLFISIFIQFQCSLYSIIYIVGVKKWCTKISTKIYTKVFNSVGCMRECKAL